MQGRPHLIAGSLVLLLLFIMLSCERKKPDESSEGALDTLAAMVENGEQEEDYIFHNEKLIAYKDFIDQLDAFQVNSMQAATDKFKSTFKSSDPATCDSAYYIFEAYYALTDDRINENHSNDTTNFEAFIMEDAILSEKLKNYQTTLKANGFRVSSTEGTTYIEKNRSFVRDNFYTYLSPVMVEYLDQLNKESDEGYWEDGGLMISSTVLVDRIVWWEVFTKQNPGFIFKNIPNQKEQLYKTSLVRGEDYTPLYDDEEKMELSGYFKEAYEYLFSKQGNSQAASDLKPYYDALIKKDTAEINKFWRAL